MKELDQLHASDTITNDEQSAFDAQDDLEKPEHAMATARRLFAQLRNQRARLTVVCCSIVLYLGFHIGAPMYSAVVVNE